MQDAGSEGHLDGRIKAALADAEDEDRILFSALETIVARLNGLGGEITEIGRQTGSAAADLADQQRLESAAVLDSISLLPERLAPLIDQALSAAQMRNEDQVRSISAALAESVAASVRLVQDELGRLFEAAASVEGRFDSLQQHGLEQAQRIAEVQDH